MYRDAAEICLNNGLTYLTISGENLRSDETFKVTKEAQALNLMTKEIDIEDVPSNQRFYSDALMILMKSDVLKDSNEFQEYFRLIQSTKIKRSLIVFTTKVTDEDVKQLKDQVRSINDNAMFQFMYREYDNDQTKYFQDIAIKNGGVVIHPHDFNKFGHMIENYNLQVKP